MLPHIRLLPATSTSTRAVKDTGQTLISGALPLLHNMNKQTLSVLHWFWSMAASSGGIPVQRGMRSSTSGPPRTIPHGFHSTAHTSTRTQLSCKQESTASSYASWVCSSSLSVNFFRLYLGGSASFTTDSRICFNDSHLYTWPGQH